MGFHTNPIQHWLYESGVIYYGIAGLLGLLILCGVVIVTINLIEKYKK